jgi:hypothetical protein
MNCTVAPRVARLICARNGVNQTSMRSAANNLRPHTKSSPLLVNIMPLGGLLLVASWILGASADMTASDLPQCAIECYCEAGEKVKIPITAYKEQCLSAPFQLAIRECGIQACSKEEFEFVHPKKCLANDRRNIKHKNIAKPIASTLFRLSQRTSPSKRVGSLQRSW